MLILGIETSCDETGAAIISGDKNSKKVKLLSNVIATSLLMHSQTGGIIPENAAREQVKYIIPVISKALSEANLKPKDIDAIAVTYGPGLIGSLLIGVETAKTLSYVWNKPLIPTNHLLGHIYANFIDLSSWSGNDHDRILPDKDSIAPALRAGRSLQNDILFPAIALVVSGGHTDLVLIKNHGNIEWLGGTRDDAAGEALDKIGRLLKLPYPGGPYIEQYAKKGNPNKYHFPRPMIGSKDFDFSFSGLKASVMREVSGKRLSKQDVSDIAACVQKAIVGVLIRKTLKAAKKYDAKSILLGGGVAANQALRDELESEVRSQKLETKIFAPSKNLCTDNAAMIAAAAFFSAKGRSASGGNKLGVPWQKVNANPNLYFDLS